MSSLHCVALQFDISPAQRSCRSSLSSSLPCILFFLLTALYFPNPSLSLLHFQLRGLSSRPQHTHTDTHAHTHSDTHSLSLPLSFHPFLRTEGKKSDMHVCGCGGVVWCGVVLAQDGAWPFTVPRSVHRSSKRSQLIKANDGTVLRAVYSYRILCSVLLSSPLGLGFEEGLGSGLWGVAVGRWWWWGRLASCRPAFFAFVLLFFLCCSLSPSYHHSIH